MTEGIQEISIQQVDEVVVEHPKAEFPSIHGPVSIIESMENDHCFELNSDFLERILLDPKVADKKVSVIGVAGAFRKGKSFLLNFFLRYLKHLGKAGDSDDNWLDSEESLKGFSWRGGAERDTTGIIIWSEPFVVKDRNGEEVVVLLMDTQGAFDSQSTVKDCATIFALSTMISSVQIYNITGNIQEDDLQHLQLFTEYGRLALEDNEDSKPFQSLLFVVRDWSYPYEAEYGMLGGYRVLDRRLQVNDKQHPELQQLRKHIRASFDDIQCFLMPHPGLAVATKPSFSGELEDIEGEFVKHLGTLVPRLLDSNNIVVKCINGQPVTCRELVVYFKVYTEIFHGEDLPEPKSILSATSEANNLAAVASAKALYVKEMEKICGGGAPYMNTVALEYEHLRRKGEAIRHFKAAKKMGGTDLSLQFLQKLDDDLTGSFENCVKVNNSKNLFKSMRTPSVLVCLMLVFFVLQEIFRLCRFDYIASFFSMILMLSICLLVTWSYSKYSGNFRECGRKIDECVQWIWDKYLKRGVNSGVQTVGLDVTKSFPFDQFAKFKSIMTGGVQEISSQHADEVVVEHPKAEFPSIPGPVSIIESMEKDHSFELNSDFLERILLDPKVADKKVSVIGVAGAFRKGKSFLLNFFLRYLKHLGKAGDSDDNWLDSEESLKGFSWRGGAERDTSGIIIWSEPFIIKDRNGEEVVVLLMDTQGAFDSQSTVKDCATIFALSTMISSVQIYNITGNIQEDDLQHLQLFTEYGRLALEDNGNSKPFQSLLFVVRDWSYPYEAEYGLLGGHRVLERRLLVNEKQHPELQQLRKHIRASFDDIQCFLMPHPGLTVATKPSFSGELEDIEGEFVKHLGTLVPRLLDSNNIVVKCINGQPVTCRELVVYFKAYIEIFHGENLPEPKSMLSATSEANNLAAVASAKALYVKEMEEVCGGDAPYMNTSALEGEHSRCKGEAIRHFKAAKKMGGTDLSLQFLQKLDDDLTDCFESFLKVNNSKNLFKSMRTPSVLVCVMLAFYMLQEIFQLFGLDYIASFFSMILVLAICLLVTWAYSKYSGNFRECGHKIDAGVQWAWDNYLKHGVNSGVQTVGPAAAAMAANKKYF